MGSKTRIEWADATWSPVTGCSHISEACQNCYAERLHRRGIFRRPMPAWKPWTAENATHNVATHEDRLEWPLRWKKPKRIFACSMGDLFHDEVPWGFIDEAFAVMGTAQHHTFLVLTKRAPDMLEWFQQTPSGARREAVVYERYRRLGLTGPFAGRQKPWPGWPLPNIWLGVTAENQRTANERIPLLLHTPAARRFVSIEPMLGEVDLRHLHAPGITRKLDSLSGYYDNSPYDEGIGNHIDWVIVGGEMGPGARPMHPAWVRKIRNDCQASGVPFFLKQRGEWLPAWEAHDMGIVGGDDGNFRKDLLRGHSKTDPTMEVFEVMLRVGKKRAGRLLDGREWNGSG